jgi:hypothetical protein
MKREMKTGILTAEAQRHRENREKVLTTKEEILH